MHPPPNSKILLQASMQAIGTEKDSFQAAVVYSSTHSPAVNDLSTVDEVAMHPAVRIVTTFWTNMREFSPLSVVRAGLLHGLVRSPSAPLSNTACRGSMNNQHTAPIPNRPLNNKSGKFQSLNHSTDFATTIGLITAPIWPAVFIVAPTTAECSRPMSSTVPQAGAVLSMQDAAASAMNKAAIRGPVE